MRKQKMLVLTALLVCGVMLLCGCGIKVKDTAVDNARTVIDVNGKTYDKQTVNNLIAYYAQQYGVSASAVQSYAISSLIREEVISQKVAEYGVDELTEEEKENAKLVAKNQYAAEVMNNYAQSFGTDADTLLGYFGFPDYVSAVCALNNEEDIPEEAYSAYIPAGESTVKQKKLSDLLTAEVVLEESDSATVQTLYDNELAADTQAYAAASALCDAYNGGTDSRILFYPEGLRYTKSMLIMFSEEDQAVVTEKASALATAKNAVADAEKAVTDKQDAAVTDEEAQKQADAAALAASAEEAVNALGEESEELAAAKQALEEANAALEKANAAVQALKDAVDVTAEQAAVETAKASQDAAQAEYDQAVENGYANAKTIADGVIARVNAGESFDEIKKEELNADVGMRSGALADKGYLISADYTDFVASYVTAAMALEKPGDISEPVRDDDYMGWFIIEYAADAPQGNVPLEEVRESFENEALTTKKSNMFSVMVNEWMADPSVKTYPEVLDD